MANEKANKADQIARFMRLFTGSSRSYGQWRPSSGAMFTEKKPPSVAAFAAHLNGKMGIGIAPINDEGLSSWGCIDVDVPEGTTKPDHVAIERDIRELGLPLITCVSKSGDAHLFLFLREPLPAHTVQSTLTNWASQLGFPGVEIFPKQTALTAPDAKGSWLNLPYFAGNKTTRFAIIGGKKASLQHFLEIAEASGTTQHFLAVTDKEHQEAPPCIQSMLIGKIKAGYRNNALYNITVYLKKKDAGTYKEAAFNANAGFEQPLPHNEAKTTINSAGKRDYRYQCQQEPMKSLCDSSTCVKRKFGITPSEREEITREMPMFGSLRKYMSDPVHWRIAVNGADVVVTTPQLMDFRKLREAIADAQTVLIPGMAPTEWETQLAKMMESAQMIETPDDASTAGVIRARLREFCRKADPTALGAEHRASIMRGVPVVQLIGEEHCVLFRGADFVDHLKRVRGEELKGVNLWLAVQKHGATARRLRIPGQKDPVTVWSVPYQSDMAVENEVIDMEPDF